MDSSGLSRRSLIKSTAAAGAAVAATSLIHPSAAEAAPVIGPAVKKAPSSGTIPTPEDYFGFKIGSDGNLAQWSKMVPYFQTIAERSDRVIYEEVGRTTNTAERAKTIDFSTPYFASGVKLLVPKGSAITDFAALAGQSVISTSGATASLWLTQCVPAAKQVLFGQTSEALTALKQQRGVAFAQDDTLLIDLATKNKDYQVVGDAKADSPWGMGVRKGDAATLAWVNAAIKKMQTDDFFWTEFQKTVTDGAIQQQFAQFVPRPGHDLTYPTGSTLSC